MKKFSLFPLILAVVGILAFISFSFIGCARITISGGKEGPLLGFFSTFAIDFGYLGKNVVLKRINWGGLVVMLLTILASICSGLLTRKNRAWYYVSTVVAAIAALIVFFYPSALARFNDTGYIVDASVSFGQITSGVLLVIMAIGNVFAAYQDKQSA